MIIEKDVPLPTNPHRKYHWDGMEVGESFFITCGDAADVLRCRNSILGSARHAGIKVSSRKVPGGLRIWRIA